MSKAFFVYVKKHYKQWAVFIVAAFFVGFFLEKQAVPAGLLLGPMLCAIVMGVRGASIRMPKNCFKFSQGVVGCLIAHTITLPVLINIVKVWDVMLVTLVITLFLSVVVGILCVRYGGLPGSTAAWGTSPGGASAMVVMAEDYGADTRVVATMQYIRVICVVLMAAVISHVLADVSPQGAAVSHASQDAIVWSGSTVLYFLITLGIIGIGFLLGRFIPAGFLLVPMLLGTVLQLSGVTQLVLPHLLIVIVYIMMGGYIGFRFDRETLKNVMYAMPVMVASSMCLILLCGVSALLVSYWLGTDYLSAYLATSPGGLDSLSIVAIDVHADVGLVVAMQALRMFSVVMLGPMLAKFIARFAVDNPKS